jgi:hypothetical protein
MRTREPFEPFYDIGMFVDRTFLSYKTIKTMNQTTLRKAKVSKKAPKNDASLKSLKDQGYHIRIEHFRKDYEDELVPDIDLRCEIGMYEHYGIKLYGGATKMTLIKDDMKVEVLSNCYWKDRFCRKYGVKACLEKLEKEHNIKA